MVKNIILEICSNGCVIIGAYKQGRFVSLPFIETGDYVSAKQLLSEEDYKKVQETWTEESILSRKTQLEEQVKIQAIILGN